MNETGSSVVAVVRKELRRLKWDELVRRGDFVANGNLGFEPLDGPIGFRADAFVKQIYRRLGSRPVGTKKIDEYVKTYLAVLHSTDQAGLPDAKIHHRHLRAKTTAGGSERTRSRTS